MSYKDAGHRPHAYHTGEKPRNPITRGPEGIRVELTTWGPTENIFLVIYDALQANWGDSPSRTVDRLCDSECTGSVMAHETGWCLLTKGERAYVESAFAGRTLPQILEGIKLHFTIDGVSRAFTHQNVRTRIGAAFMQHGGRDNDWRHRTWTMPETIVRACEAYNGEDIDMPFELSEGRKHCIGDWSILEELVNSWADRVNPLAPVDLNDCISWYLSIGRQLYSALVDAGIPWQDARRVLWMGTQTYIHDIYDYLSLKQMLANRLEHIMDWEHNCVAQLMVREVRMKCPPILGKYLMSHSDAQKKAAFAGLESWPPDMKYDPNFPCVCGHEHSAHQDMDRDVGLTQCDGCVREGGTALHRYMPSDPLVRAHSPEQNPYWILSPESMAGGPIEWIPTNGIYPEELRPARNE